MNPEDLSAFISCENEACFDAFTTAYPISMNMSSQIVDIILKTKVNPFLTYPSDNKNDFSSDSISGPKKI